MSRFTFIFEAAFIFLLVGGMLGTVANQTTGQVKGGTSNVLDQIQPYDPATANAALPNHNQRVGTCLSPRLTGSLLTMQVEFATAGAPNGTLFAEVWPTTGNAPAKSCIAGVGAILATSTNSILGSTVTNTAFQPYTFTFTGTTLTLGTYYLVDIFYSQGCNPNPNCLFIAFSTGTAANDDEVLSGCNSNGWGGTCGQLESFACNVPDNCMGYVLTTNPYTIGNPNITSSPGIPVVVPVLAIVFVGFGGMLVWTDYQRQGRGGIL